MADNTFATARNLGFLERGGVRTIQGKDSLAGSDRTDVYKFTIQPGAAFKVRSSFQTQSGKMSFSFFVKNPLSGQITKLAGSKKSSSKSSSDIPVQTIPAGAPPLDCYIAFDKPTQNLKYQFKLTSL
ncbi:hypothetical protein IFO70_23515 [Phormidium tenue FACHB-886]|nr:hypothetical protein [Phormidium tenue FACHB-886]